MTPFPLPIPTTVAEPQPAQDIGGVVVTFRCATELAGYAVPVIDRLRQRHRAKGVEHGLSTPFGFSRWLLRQDGEAQFAITSPGHAGGEGTGGTTDDLTVALWVEASQADAVHRAAVHRHPVDFSSAVSFTRAAMTAVEGGGSGELVLHRRRPSAHGDSGWVVRTADPSSGDDKGEDVQVAAGRLVEIAPHLVPYLALPVGTVVRVAEGRFLGAWWTASKTGTITAADHQLLDEEGHGPGVRRGDDAAPSRTTVERVIEEVTLRARAHPDLAGLAESVLLGFADAGTPLAAGSRLESSYVTYSLAAGDDGGVLLVTAPDFSSPSAYREGRSDDLTAALEVEAEQATLARRAGVEPEPVRAADVIAIQQGALDDLTHHRPTSYVMEREARAPGSESLADGARRSGWSITTPSAQSERSRAVVHVDAGELQACDDIFAPYYMLPVGTLLEFAHGNLHSAHLVDEGGLEALARQHPERSMHDLLATGEVSRPLFDPHGTHAP